MQTPAAPDRPRGPGPPPRPRRRAHPALFLHELAADEVQERLIEVNRTFTAPAVVTGFPDLWQRAMPVRRIVSDDEVLALEPGAHDLVIHALACTGRTIRWGSWCSAAGRCGPTGCSLRCCSAGRRWHELRACLAEAEAAVTGGLSPRVLPMGEIRDLGGAAAAGGLCAAGGRQL